MAIGIRHLALPILLIPIASFFILFGVIDFAESAESETEEKLPIKTRDGVICEPGTTLANNYTQCLPICPEGTIFKESKYGTESFCEPDVPVETYEIHFLMAGIVIAAVATGIGLVLTRNEHKKEDNKRTQELLKSYSEELTGIQDQERTLKTQLDCELYAGQYLDTLEQISALIHHKIFDDDAIDYFYNNFAYGRSLWWWYYKYIHGIPDDAEIDRIFRIFDKQPENTKSKTENEKNEAINNFLSEDRWPYFREFCVKTDPEITYYKLDFGGLGGYDDSRENWRVLPDLMYYDYDKIPKEDGLTKAEFVEIVRPFANDLSGFVEKEKQMITPDEFEVYSELYLETLEQIATLYKNKIIPEKAKEYFENKFSYGINLWLWYYDRPLKFSKKLCNALWNTINCKQERLDKVENTNEKLKTALQKFEDCWPPLLKQLPEKDKKLIRELNASRSQSSKTEEELEAAQQRFEDAIIAILKRENFGKELRLFDKFKTAINEVAKAKNDAEDEKIKTENYCRFLEHYSPDESEVKEGINDAADLFILEEPDVWKLVKQTTNDDSKKEIIRQFIDAVEQDLNPLKDTAFKKGEELVSLRKAKNPNEIAIRRAEKSLKTAEDAIKMNVKNRSTHKLNEMDEEFIYQILKEFVNNFLSNERWRDFRSWCMENELTAFVEDPDEGLVLPLKMWQAQYK